MPGGVTANGDLPPADLRRARHNLRGRLNAIKLCISALPTCETPQESAEFLESIEVETEHLVQCLDQYEALYDAQAQDR